MLQAVQGRVRLATEQLGHDPDTARHLLDAVDDVTQRGTAVTRRLLTLAWTRRSRQRAGPVDVAALFGGMQAMLAHTLEAYMRVRVEFEPGLPAVLASSGELETVLVNLATNARDAMPNDGTLTLSAGAEQVTEAEGAAASGLLPGCSGRIADYASMLLNGSLS